MYSDLEIYEALEKFSFGIGVGLGAWLTKDRIATSVLNRLRHLDKEPISKVQLNQLLVISGVASVSDGFFRYYWLETPKHTYNIKGSVGAPPNSVTAIQSLEHFRWGLERLFIDCLLYFGNVRAGFQSLRSLKYEDIVAFFVAKRFDTPAISARGPSLPLKQISKDDRYLISEMACKSYGKLTPDSTVLQTALVSALEDFRKTSAAAVSIRELLSGDFVKNKYENAQTHFTFSADDILDEQVQTADDLLGHYSFVAKKFESAHTSALENTDLYLSVVNDLDVYVATSMRTRDDFRKMATACEQIFSDPTIQKLHLRYFDPTMSAADGHEDKGLIECLMVKCAKILVYCAGARESYGKDAEAAMALSLGKPVVFLCDPGQRASFYKDVHPLSRLIDFRSGVAVGALVTDNVDDVVTLLERTLSNGMHYALDHHPDRKYFLRLIDRLTGSVVRVQTDNDLLTRTFWNNYNNRYHRGFVSLAAGKEAERLQE